jgi:hypothetical protein
MRGSTKALFAAAGLAVAAVGVGVYSFTRPAELPELREGAHREVFPDLDFGAAVPGSSIDRIYGAFGKQSADAATSAAGRRCIYFVYDPDLFEGALAILANAKLVEKRWVVKGSAKPEECSGLPEERVELRGWYAAAAR